MKESIALVLLAGCFGYEPIPAERPPPVLRKLADAEILDMRIDPQHKQPALCPGGEGKLYMHAMVKWPNMKPVEKHIGRDVDSLQASSFAIEGPLVQGDADAHLHPSGDVLASVETGFEMHVVYTPIPHFQFQTMLPPEYSCFTGLGDNGGMGQGGENGAGGENAQNYGEQGYRGRDGTPGFQGGHGGRVSVVATMVKTRFYPKLIAVIANDRFFLAPPDQRLVFSAAGGPGGPGGSGGPGGRGGDQKTESAERWNESTQQKETYIRGIGGAGRGGNGGDGAQGGDGGDGGTVDIVYDPAFPELADLLGANVEGGPPGENGAGGNGGEGGSSNADEDKAEGGGGDGGNGPRTTGRSGHRGRASSRAGNVSGRFANLRGIQLLGRGR